MEFLIPELKRMTYETIEQNHLNRPYLEYKLEGMNTDTLRMRSIKPTTIQYSSSVSFIDNQTTVHWVVGKRKCIKHM